ncbi:transposase-like protein, IS1239 [Streptococcus pneumoniae]|nr:transposase-like protein, IS1239 [Streptococcus pneumoniae]
MQEHYTPKGKHLTIDNRRLIERWKNENKSNREIAGLLGKAPQTIHNEVAPFKQMSCNIHSYAVLAIVSNSYPPLPGRLPTRYSPVRNSSREASSSFSVLLACIRHAASVRPEPGSNSH